MQVIFLSLCSGFYIGKWRPLLERDMGWERKKEGLMFAPICFDVGSMGLGKGQHQNL